MKHLGFTGTQNALNHRQLTQLWLTLLDAWDDGFTVLHHGDCIGADTAAHQFAVLIGFDIVIHPPINDIKRAFNGLGKREQHRISMLYPDDYLKRNHAIVRASELLIACPSSVTEELRSGTWATVRFARKQGTPITLITPEGDNVYEAH